MIFLFMRWGAAGFGIHVLGEFDGLFSAGSRTKGLEAALVADFASPSAGACLWVNCHEGARL